MSKKKIKQKIDTGMVFISVAIVLIVIGAALKETGNGGIFIIIGCAFAVFGFFNVGKKIHKKLRKK